MQVILGVLKKDSLLWFPSFSLDSLEGDDGLKFFYSCSTGPAELIEFIDIINNEVKSIVQSALIPHKLSELCFHCDWAGNTSLHLSDSNQCDTSLDITNDPNNAKVDDKLEKE